MKNHSKTNFNARNASGELTSSLIANLQPFFLTTNAFVKKSQSIKPSQSDTLFWCYYILKNGHSAYEQLFQCDGENGSVITYVREKQIKIKLVEELRNPIMRNKLKLCKLCSIDHVEDLLANEKTIDLATFFSLCFIADIQLFYFKNSCYCKTIPGELPWMNGDRGGGASSKREEEDVSIFDDIYDRYGTGYDEDDYDFATIRVLKQTAGKYWIEIQNVLDIEWSQCYHIENVNKPLKGVSSYTAAQIKELAKRFGIEVKGKNKQELYDQVKSNIKIDII
jgi:hypothetical protein